MVEIKDILFENIPVIATRELLHELYELTEGSEYVKTQMTAVYTPWKQAYEVMAQVYGLPLGNVETTNTIFNLDSRRDMAFKAFELYVKLAKASEDPEMVAAAEAMERTMTSFPVNVNSGYLSQTAQMDSFLGVALGEQLEVTTKIGALKLVQDMKQFNDQIHTLVASRDVLRVERNALPSRPVARQQAIDSWRFLAKYANSVVMLNFDGSVPEGLTQFINLVNTKWDRYVSIYLGGNGSGNGSSTVTPPAEGGSEEEGSEEGGSEEGGSEGEQETTPKYKAFFYVNGALQDTLELEAGTVIQAPEAPAGYEWEEFPYRMPANDITVNAVRKYVPGGGGGSGFE